MAKAPNIRGHKLKLGKPKDGKISGTCSCGGWKGDGKDVAEVQRKWSQTHVNKFDSYR